MEDIENIRKSMEYVEDLILAEKPLVIDAGSTFTDASGNVHKEACGWLAIHAGLHLLYHLDYLHRLPTLEMFLNKKLIPEELKKLSMTTSLNARITDDDFNAIGNAIGIKFYIYEPGNNRRQLGKRRDATMLFLYRGLSHYYVNVTAYSRNKVMEHVNLYPQYYELVDLAARVKCKRFLEKLSFKKAKELKQISNDEATINGANEVLNDSAFGYSIEELMHIRDNMAVSSPPSGLNIPF